jgi:ribulose 1,5-bisphosphate synthetase/thiazole synthase
LPFVSEKIKIQGTSQTFSSEGNLLPGGYVMDFVIIGGDAAGMSAASRAKRNKPDLQIIVLEQTKDVSYSA